MNKTKRLLALVLALVMSLTLFACGRKAQDDKTDDSTRTEDTTRVFTDSCGREVTVAVLLAVFVHPATYWQLIPPGLLFVAVYAASMWLFGMNRYERGLVTGPLRRILHRQ